MRAVYLDACCLNRPFDDQRQLRVRVESEAVRAVIQAAAAGSVRWVSSEIVDFELGRNPDMERRQRVEALASLATARVIVGPAEQERGRALAVAGFGVLDALHIACAERGAVDALLTTDDKLVRRAARYVDRFGVQVVNPMVWVAEELTR